MTIWWTHRRLEFVVLYSTLLAMEITYCFSLSTTRHSLSTFAKTGVIGCLKNLANMVVKNKQKTTFHFLHSCIPWTWHQKVKNLKWNLFHLSYEYFDFIFYSLFKQQTTLYMGLPAWQPTRDVGRTREDLVNHEPKASDLQLSFSSVLPTSQVGSHAGKPIESVVYCFYKITLKHVLVVYEFTGTIDLVPRTFPLGRLRHNKP